ncbi:MAG: CotH kinase family protein [Leucothrix sp.]
MSLGQGRENIMYKHRKALQTLLLASCLLPVIHVSADVLSSTTTSDLVEPTSTYDSSIPSLLTMRVKTVIGTGPCEPGVYDGCTLSDVLNDIDSSDNFKPEIKVKMTADDFPDDGSVSNAELRQRGATSRLAPQKSFRVKLDSSDALWRGERRVQLVKSFPDFSRIRNKLSYDLFTDIPNLPSMRTQFVNLEVEDQGTVEDYGLYTHIEHFGKEYLVRRNWDKDSGVYKAENFFFKNDPVFALDAAGKPLDEDAFETRMEIKRGDDHRSFVKMLGDINNPSLDFNTQVFNKYFNKDNYLTWLAVNILLDNYDTNFHNFYLYNPKGTEKFYFVPWDYDLSLGASFDTGNIERSDLARWTQTHANWWGQTLHQQFLRQPGNLALLSDAMREIRDKYLSRAKLQQKADSYYNFVFPFVSSSPDIDNLYLGGTDPEKIAGFNRVFSSLAKKVERNFNLYHEKNGDPMPFNLDTPELSSNNESYNFSWSPSESLLGQTINYDLEIATSPTFDEGSVIFSRNGIWGNNVNVPWNYAAGNYFYRITARDRSAPTRYWQVGYNELILENGRRTYGVVAFTATIDRGSPGPVGNPDIVSTPINTAKTLDVLANDTGSGLYIASSNPWSEFGGTVSIANNKINYQPKSNFSGTDRIWYNLKDAQGRSNFSVATITIASDSDYPIGNPDTVATPLNNTLTIDVLANDTGAGRNITSTNPYSLKGGNVSITDGRIIYKPKQEFTGEDKLWYVFEDSQGRANSAEVTINVSGVAAYPVALTDDITTTANTPITLNPLGNDTGVGLRIAGFNEYSLTGGRVAMINGQLRYTPTSGYRGTDSFWYVIGDNFGRTNAAKVNINVQ